MGLFSKIFEKKDTQSHVRRRTNQPDVVDI